VPEVDAIMRGFAPAFDDHEAAEPAEMPSASTEGEAEQHSKVTEAIVAGTVEEGDGHRKPVEPKCN
jgi:hypothetical protein